MSMTCRERALAALHRLPSDVPAVQYYFTDVGVYEHGEKLNELFAAHPGDFAPFTAVNPPYLPPEVFAEGRYHEIKTDAWGTEWEYRIVGRMGHAIRYPIRCMEDYESYVFPLPPDYVTDKTAFAHAEQIVRHEKESYVCMRGEGYSYLDRLFALRGFEDAMCDLYERSPLVHSFFDRLTEYYLLSIHRLLDMGVDAISFGDDYGSQSSLLISPELFRHMIFPYLDRLMTPIRRAGVHIHFHSCGQISELFPVFEELGVGSIWPQLPLYDMNELAAACKRHRFALAIHTDRAETMTHGTPDDVRRLVRREYEVFRPDRNGGWFYIEVDHGFPFANIEALINEIYLIRNGG